MATCLRQQVLKLRFLFDFWQLPSLHCVQARDPVLCIQEYQTTTDYKLGGGRTGFLLWLDVANVTYIPKSARIDDLRTSELMFASRESPACGGTAPGRCLRSVAVLDMCAVQLLH